MTLPVEMWKLETLGVTFNSVLLHNTNSDFAIQDGKQL